jgi:hypothetical protein
LQVLLIITTIAFLLVLAILVATSMITAINLDSSNDIKAHLVIHKAHLVTKDFAIHATQINVAFHATQTHTALIVTFLATLSTNVLLKHVPQMDHTLQCPIPGPAYHHDIKLVLFEVSKLPLVINGFTTPLVLTI